MTGRLELSERTRVAMQAAIDDIARALRHPPPSLDNDPVFATSLAVREPGFALFYAYLDQVAPSARLRQVGNRHLDHAIQRVPDASHRPFFSYGFAGTGWAVQHLAGWFVDVDQDSLAAIDDGLLELVLQAPTLSFDLQHGLVGFGLYALERQPAPRARRLLEAIIRRLAQMAEPRGRGLTWRVVNAEWVETPYVDDLFRGVYVPTMYNGVAGVVGLLAGAIRANVAVDESYRLLERALHWCWAELRSWPWSKRLASVIDGRLGIVAVTFAAARAAGLHVWERKALATARRIARTPNVRLRECNLATGVAGAALVFMRLHRETGDRLFADTARAYLDRLLRRRVAGEGVAGFRTYSPKWQRGFLARDDYPVGWIGVPGFLDGAAGIGLTLIAALHDREPAWDRALLLSLRSA